ncbi:MAG: protein-disulfide reductase DsbD [Rhodocyclaceae bacterium]|nr:protein-disulfide reductase DsbD [Rhodocyclaceae bacterium]MBK7813888.1 protein-disulfide reductase DsbD [Rhodocyclaceae bacterium]MBK9310234.1 protein-disulfide reductase DsbD [Rhodocyclaceae bacterium]MBK9954696.1 protein-disulfide reductase DsbD [Rhodocyclaceae bacterium]
MTPFIRCFALLLALAVAPSLFAADEPLEPEQAYRFSVQALDAHSIEARWQIENGYYMYRDKFKFAAEPATVKLGEPKFPAGKIKDDEFFGKVETYRSEVKIVIPVEANGAESFTLKATSQGCWDEGICYPPMVQKASVGLVAAPQMSVAPAAMPAARPAEPARTASETPAAGDGDESSKIAGLLRDGGFWMAIASFFGFGLLLSLTPCVFPMVPILSGIIVNHGHAVTHARAFWLSSAYVLGMAITYAAVGVAAGYSGTLLSSALQNAWVLGVFALVFVALSLSMFGFYELQVPAALQGRLSEKANARGGSFGAIAAMGALSALIVGPCVAAPLAGALLYIAQTKDAALGGAALFTMALGMGAPLILVGVFSRSLLPKAGPWMEAVKKFFGVLLLATALWLVSPVIPSWTLMLGWAALLIIPAIYMHALDPLPPHVGGWHRLWKGIGVLMLLGGAAMLLGMLGGARDPLQPLGFLRGEAVAGVSPGLTFERVKTTAELDARLQEAAARGQPVMLDFYADWCVSCKEMEKFTFTDARVKTRLAGTRLLQADVTANNDADKALLKRFKLFGPPGIIFFDGNGKEIADVRVIGYQPADRFLATLGKVPL